MSALGYLYRCDWQGNFSTKHLRASRNISVLIKAKLGSNDPCLFIDHFLSFPLRGLEESAGPVRQLPALDIFVQRGPGWPSLFIKHFMDVQLLHMRNQIITDRERESGESGGMKNCKD